MNLLRDGLLMRTTADRRRTELTEGSVSQCGFSAEFIPRSRKNAKTARMCKRIYGMSDKHLHLKALEEIEGEDLSGPLAKPCPEPSRRTAEPSGCVSWAFSFPIA